METLGYILSLISGGLIFELFKLLYPDLKKLFSVRIEAKNIINKHSDLILKTADELFGKIYSLAKEDFQALLKYDDDKDEFAKLYIIYLFASFWASLAILKQESSYIHLARIKRGKRLLAFVTTYESRKNRILDRSLQRAIGESVIITNNSGLQIMPLFTFICEYRSQDSRIKHIIKPLEESLIKTKIKEHRQKYLMFGMILSAFINHLDKKHRIVRDRKPYINKLKEKTKEELELRIFNAYLPFVQDPDQYY